MENYDGSISQEIKPDEQSVHPTLRFVVTYSNPMKSILSSFVAFSIATFIAACSNSNPSQAEAKVHGHSDTRVLQHPDWSKNATIYEVNIRQHTPEGTFSAFTKDIPRLKAMGVDILWLMPIHPIGEVNRKGGL